MKVTKEHLKRIIKEELEEGFFGKGAGEADRTQACYEQLFQMAREMLAITVMVKPMLEPEMQSTVQNRANAALKSAGIASGDLKSPSY
jgi:hypothetical protein